MSPEELKALRELLGEGFSLKEVEDLAREDPGLLASASTLVQAFKQPYPHSPPLSPDFTKRVLQALPAPSPWKELWKSVGAWRSFAWVAATALFCGVAYMGYQHVLTPKNPVARTQDGAAPIVTRRVRFQMRPARAQSVAVAGDFNQWRAWPLQKQGDGSFAGEWDVPEGNYAYSFLVDGQSWVPDPAAETQIEDGFRGKSSILSL